LCDAPDVRRPMRYACYGPIRLGERAGGAEQREMLRSGWLSQAEGIMLSHYLDFKGFADEKLARQHIGSFLGWFSITKFTRV
jgi:hypothetical protein